uniref:Ankyrin repeat and SOCS box containing 18 n=1 Tax=Eptatretus burgeri TaxID=7764 RepID=A0A8C4NKD6_EPTBU
MSLPGMEKSFRSLAIMPRPLIFPFSSPALRSLQRLRDEQDCTRNPQTTFWRLPETPSSRSSSLQQSPVAVLCRDPLVHNALFTGHLDLVRRIFTEPCIASACMDCAADQEHGESKVSGLWPLPSQRVHTTPACITASRGYEACLRHLLERGADPEAAPGGECALHCACEGAHQACVQLLLEYGARPNSCSEPGLTPLHMCTVSESLGCAERLLAAGARLQEEASLTGDTPLHTASTHGLVGHVNLYLSSGAHVDARNARGETPLHVACMSARGALDGHRYLQVCDLLLTYGATVDAVDAEMQTPLLRACVNVQSGVVRRLLNAGADPNARGYCGVAPLQKVLQMADYRPEQRPERLVQDLLNHGAIKFWPGALHKVLSHTCASVSTVEVLLNGYNYFKVTKAWRDAVPEEVQQANKDFYRSLFALSGQPRRLQHLARCALRSYLGAACHRLVPALPIPAALRSYLLLEPQGIMH